MTPQRGLVSDRTPCLGQAGRSLLPTLGPRGKARRGPRGPGPEPQGSEEPRRHPQPPGAGRHASAAPGLGGLTPRWCCPWGDFAQMCARVYTRVYVLIQPGHDTRVCLCLCTRTHKPGSHKPAQARVVKGHGALCGPGGVWCEGPGSVVPETSPEAQLCSSPAQTSVSPRPQQRLERQAFSFPAFVGLSVASPHQLVRRTQSHCTLGRFRPQAGHRSALCPQPAHASACGVEGPA